MNTFLLIAILLLLGLLSTRIVKRISLPNVTAFLVIGLLFAIVCILIDEYGHTTNLAEELSNVSSFVSSIALGFIALSIGEEFRLSKLKAYGSKIVLITILQALFAVILVDIALVVVCTLFRLNLAIAFCLGAIACATAPAATLMVIHQYNAKGPLVDLLLPVVAFDDAIGLVIFAISLSISKIFVTTAGISFVSIALIPLLEIIGSLALGFTIGVLLNFVTKYFKSRNNHMIIIIAFTCLSVGLCMTLNQLKIDGEKLEFSSLLCCMMAGMVHVNWAKKEDEPILTRDIELTERWTPFLFMLFFVLSGANLITTAWLDFTSDELNLIVPILVILIVYLLFRSSGKYFGAYLGCKITNREKSTTKYLGFTLLPQAGVAIGMAYQIRDIEEFHAFHIADYIVIVALCATLVYELIGPLLTKWSLKRAGEIPAREEEK